MLLTIVLLPKFSFSLLATNWFSIKKNEKWLNSVFWPHRQEQERKIVERHFSIFQLWVTMIIFNRKKYSISLQTTTWISMAGEESIIEFDDCSLYVCNQHLFLVSVLVVVVVTLHYMELLGFNMLDKESLIEYSNIDVTKGFKKLGRYSQWALVMFLLFLKHNDLNIKMNDLWWDNYLLKNNAW